jgi:hypothetical protein
MEDILAKFGGLSGATALKKIENTLSGTAGRHRFGAGQTQIGDRAALPDTWLNGTVRGARAANARAVVGEVGLRTGGYAKCVRAAW